MFFFPSLRILLINCTAFKIYPGIKIHNHDKPKALKKISPFCKQSRFMAHKKKVRNSRKIQSKISFVTIQRVQQKRKRTQLRKHSRYCTINIRGRETLTKEFSSLWHSMFWVLEYSIFFFLFNLKKIFTRFLLNAHRRWKAKL